MLIIRFIIAIYKLDAVNANHLYNAKILINDPRRKILREYRIFHIVELPNQPIFIFGQRTSEFKHLAHAVLKLTNM